MKVIIAFAAIVSLAAGGAWARTPTRPVGHHVRHHPHRIMAAAHVRYQPAAKPAASRRPVAFQQDASAPPDQPGWFKTRDEAGWGFSQGRAQTMVGLYKRPERPDLPGPQIYHHEGDGAAGVAISLKLGH